jgi:hypothetical protein
VTLANFIVRGCEGLLSEKGDDVNQMSSRIMSRDCASESVLAAAPHRPPSRMARNKCVKTGQTCFDTKAWWEMAERFVDGLKAAGAGFFAGVPVMFPCGCPCTDKCVCSNDCIKSV